MGRNKLNMHYLRMGTKADSILDATHVISDSPWLEGVDELET